MIYIIFLVCSALGAKSSRFLNPKTDVIRETIQDYNYMANLNQSILFQYANYYGTYSMSLKSEGKNEIPLAQSIDGNFSQGCHPYSRKIAQQQLFNTTPRLPFETPETLQGIITSVYAANYFVFILRSDFKLFIMKIDYNKQHNDIIDFTQHQIVDLTKEFDNINEKSQLLNSELLCSQYLKQGGQIFCFIISEYGVLQFSYNQIDENMVSISKLFNLKKETINHIFFSDENELLFITYPTAGVDVYKMNPSGDLQLIINIIPNGLTNLKQAKMDEASNYLFILNERLGVHIYNFNIIAICECTINKPNLSKRIIWDTFDFHRNTMFILAQTEDSLQYALEIFIDFKEEQYYFNQIHSFGQDVYDVYVGNLFVLFVGSDRLHQVIYHSVYKDFDAQHEQFYFSDIDLIQVDELNPPWKQQLYNGKAFEDGILSQVNLTYTETFLVGISENEVSLFRIRLIPPWVLCTAFEPKIEYYSLTLNSTVCPSLKDQVQNQFKYCQVQANFSFEGVSVLMYEEHQSYFILVVIILISMILILFITLLICRKRLYQKLSDQEEKQIEEYSKREQLQLDTENIKTMI